MNDTPSEESSKTHVRGSIPAGQVDLRIEPPAPKATEPSSTFNWDTVLKIVGAAVALGLWVQVVGGAVVWGRFREAGLPANSIVGQVPDSVLITVGLRALALPVAIGIGAVAVFSIAQAIEKEPNKANTVPVAVIAAIVLLAVAEAIAAAIVLDAFSRNFWLAILFMAISLALLGGLGATSAGGYAPLAALAFAVTAAWGGALAYMAELDSTPRFDLTALLRKQETRGVGDEAKAQDREPVAGFLVGYNDDNVLVATTADYFDSEKWRVVVIPRDHVEEMSVGPRCPVTKDALEAAEAMAEELEIDQGEEDEPITAYLDERCMK